MPRGFARNLRLRLSRGLVNGGRAVATVRRNGSDTSLRCEIDAADLDLECTSSGTVSFAAGDLLSISYLGEGQAPNTRVLFLLEFQGGG
ncbi:MAG TPA: hypothetical protein VMW27_04200 [Thermoanaerobaculia bacterium]|nr:hypothetical protein [Thermoanaerobaculia bacterium]